MVASGSRRRNVTNSNSRTRVEVIRDMSAPAGAVVFATACFLNLGLLIYVTIGNIG